MQLADHSRKKKWEPVRAKRYSEAAEIFSRVMSSIAWGCSSSLVAFASAFAAGGRGIVYKGTGSAMAQTSELQDKGVGWGLGIGV